MSLIENFADPLYLTILLVAIPLVWWLSRRSLAGLSAVRRHSSVALRFLVVLLILLALAEFRILWENDRLAVIYLVDRSASIPARGQDDIVNFIRRSAEYRDRARGDAVGVVSFGRTAGIERAPRPEGIPADFSFQTFLEKDYTDIQAGIRLAMAAFPEGYGKRLVIITDGNENRGRVIDEARVALSEGATIDVLSVRYDYAGEILLDKIVVDPEIHVGEPFEIRVVAESTRNTKATLRVFENQQLIRSELVDLEPGKNVFKINRSRDHSDIFLYEAVLEPASASEDGIVANNSASTFTFISGQPKVLLCTDDAEKDGKLVRAIRSENINVEVRGPNELYSDPRRYVHQYDAIVFSNVSSYDITQEQMQLMENLVKGAGIGFVMIGGDRSFGAGGYLGTPIEALLPVTMDAKQKKKLPNGALAIVMHSCEINNGNYWAKQTVQQAIRVLSPKDYAGVLYYDYQGGDRWLFPLLPCSNKQLMLNRLTNFAPGDMPSFANITKQAYKGLMGVKASIKHMIIFSDGDPQPPSPQLLQQYRKAKITISTICMGWHSSPAAMRQLAKDGGGNFYTLSGPENLPEIFIREATTVRKALIQERDVDVQVRRGGSFLVGLDLDSLPNLSGYVITTEKEQADHFLSADPFEDDPTLDPILSSWSYGLGKSVAFTSDSGRAWASSWASWEGYQKFWGQLIRWVSRSRTDDNFRVSRRREGDRGIVLIDAIDPAGNFINGIDFESTIITPDDQVVEAEVVQRGPGRYRLEYPLSTKGVYLVSLKYERNGEGRLYSTGMTIPYSPEYRKLETNDVLLNQIASTADGEVLDRAVEEGRYDQIFRAGFTGSQAPQDLWRILLFLAAILFFVDVFVRRVIVDYGAVIMAGVQRVTALVSRRHVVRDEADARLGQLLKRKADVQRARTSRPRFYADRASGEGGETGTSGEAGATFDASFDAGARAPVRKPPAAKKTGVAPPASVPDQEDGYTSRLLAAKRRALRSKKDDKESSE